MAEPSTLSDEELDAQINNPTPDEPETPEPDEPENEEPETPEVEEPETPEEPEADPEEEPAPPSRRETLRIQQILEKRQKQETGKPQARPDALNYEEALNAPPEVIQALTADREAAENARYQEGLRQAQAMEWRTMIHVDTPRVEAKFPHLDKNSPEYHPAITKAMYDSYLNSVGYDSETGTVQYPNIRFSDFVESQYELADEIAAQKTQSTAQNLAKQASQTGLRPDGSTPKRMNLNQDPSAMSDEELDAIIGQAIPKR